MGAYKIKTVITADGKIILPKKYKDLYKHKVEILLYDQEAQDEDDSKININVAGSLKKYSNISLINKEKSAWLESTKEKHANN